MSETQFVLHVIIEEAARRGYTVALVNGPSWEELSEPSKAHWRQIASAMLMIESDEQVQEMSARIRESGIDREIADAIQDANVLRDAPPDP